MPHHHPDSDMHTCKYTTRTHRTRDSGSSKQCRMGGRSRSRKFLMLDMSPMAAAARAIRPPFRWFELVEVQNSCLFGGGGRAF